MPEDNSEGVVEFDKGDYDRLRSVVDDVAKTTQDALWTTEGYSIGPDLRAQPAQATWDIAAQVGNNVNRLATQVRTYTDTLCERTLPDYSHSVARAAETLEETDNTASSDANGNG